ncbi:hypothetical protein [Arthrospiribacter ruber]|uniref:Uncharacterized protein n=1 Tax=Arthrospiribacter ruber TaxID=2487934 RepID=A0A951ME76_9BACT|nr:hypothetical protein [Arthrospiribacter ruber]MBW3469509.1 hypothetical protein [Arthrospiribacter ruber]
MKKFEKKFIGKGSRVKSLEIVRLTISEVALREALENDLTDFKGSKFLVIEVASLKKADKYGRSHTVYINKKLE